MEMSKERRERAIRLMRNIPSFIQWSGEYVDFESWVAEKDGMEYGWRISVQAFSESLYPAQVWGILMAIPTYEADPDWSSGVQTLGRQDEVLEINGTVFKQPPPEVLEKVLESARAFLRDMPPDLVEDGDFGDLFKNEVVLQ